MDGNGVCSGPLVANRGGQREKMGCAARIGSGIKWGGGRTGGMSRMWCTSGENVD